MKAILATVPKIFLIKVTLQKANQNFKLSFQTVFTLWTVRLMSLDLIMTIGNNINRNIFAKLLMLNNKAVYKRFIGIEKMN
jgi:hypothetical protein